MFHLLLTTAEVQKLEDEVNTLYQVAAYALPFITALVIGVGAAIYKIQSSVKKNSSNIGVVASATNGKVDTLLKSVADLHTKVNSIQEAQQGVSNATNETGSTGNTGSTGTGSAIQP